MPSQTRIKMIDATVTALQRRGVAGMSFTDVLASSGAARGAIYHHFPGGKTQIVTEAAARNGQDVDMILGYDAVLGVQGDGAQCDVLDLVLAAIAGTGQPGGRRPDADSDVGVRDVAGVGVGVAEHGDRADSHGP